MKKLSEFIKKKKIEVSEVDTKPAEIKKFKFNLPMDISFILEKFLPQVSIRQRLPRKNFYTIISKSLMSVVKKQIETDLVHSSRDRFNICLDPFVSLKKLKLEYCEYFDSRFLTNTINSLILHDIKKIKLENISLNYLEIGYMKNNILKSFKNCKCIKLKILNMNLTKVDIPIDFYSIELVNCEIETEKIFLIIMKNDLIDFSFITKNFTVECKRNFYIFESSLNLKCCPKEFYLFNYGIIKNLILNSTEYISNLKIKNLESIRLECDVINSNELKKFLLQFRMKKIFLQNSNISQTVLFDLVIAFSDCLRELDIRGCEITSDFIKFMKKNLQFCTVYYGNVQCIKIKQ